MASDSTQTALAPIPTCATGPRPSHSRASSGSSVGSSGRTASRVGNGAGPREARGAGWVPSTSNATFKEVLIFEERLKQNAERLQRQRRKYEVFLIVLLGWSAYLSWAVFVEPSLYSLIHYSNTALLLVSLTTLALFFATGIYADKIAYAYKFVPQTNRALRPFNVYLNTRARGWRGWLGGGWRWFGGGLVPRALRPEAPLLSRTNSTSSVASAGSRPASPILGLGLGGGGGGAGRLSRRTSGSSEASFASTTAPSVRSVGSGAMRSPQHSPPASPTLNSSHLTMPTARPNTPPTAAAAATATTAPPSPPSITAVTRAPLPSRRPPPLAMPLAPIPPPANARGELIFSSRVSGPFREGYEKYREGWEARRAEQAGASGSGGGWLGGWFGK